VSAVALAAAALALAAAFLLLAAPILRRRRLHARSPVRILFPFLGTTISRTALDSALRLAEAETATLVPAYLASVPLRLTLEAPIPTECEVAMPLLETIEQRATRLGIPVDPRIERGRTPRHALAQLLDHERYDRVVIPAKTAHSEGFESDDIAWLLEHAQGELVVLRPAANEAVAPARETLSA
jgi:universal stress protein family protein